MFFEGFITRCFGFSKDIARGLNHINWVLRDAYIKTFSNQEDLIYQDVIRLWKRSIWVTVTPTEIIQSQRYDYQKYSIDIRYIIINDKN